ncbi:MAG TPA: hypothetical protein VFH61_08730 [Thermoleophilia bacterium]|nr:hypothetical protein [Thermoleophilia bacterium]
MPARPEVGSEHYHSLPPFPRLAIAREALQRVLDNPIRDMRTEAARQWLTEAVRYELQACAMADPGWDLNHHYEIRDKHGNLVPYRPKVGQSYLRENFEEARLAGIPGRWLIGKTRRVGGTCESTMYSTRMVHRLPGKRLLIVAHEKGVARVIMRNYVKAALASDPWAPTIETDTRDEVQFAEPHGGAIHVRTVASGEGIAAGDGYHFCVLSEAARYEEVARGFSVDDLVSNLLTTVPTTVGDAENDWTNFVFETTGRGPRGMFHREVINLLEGNPSTWKFLFLDSTFRWDAIVRFESPRERDDFERSLSDHERAVMLKYDASLEHMAWRRVEERDHIQGATAEEKRRRMLREHPLEPLHMFQSFSKQVFDAEKVDQLAAHDRCREEPKPGETWPKHGNLDLHDLAAPLVHAENGKPVRKTPRPRWVDHVDGDWIVWSPPKPHHRYAMAWDFAEGHETGHWTTCSVLDRDTMRKVARFRGKPSEHEINKQLRLASAWYNDGLINPEVNRFPQYVRMLSECDRAQFLFERMGASDAVGRTVTDKYGWWSGNSTKPLMVSALHGALETFPQFFVDPLSLSEMRTYEGKELASGKLRYGAPRGTASCSDDVLDSDAMVLIAHRDAPLRGKPPKDLQPKKDRMMGVRNVGDEIRKWAKDLGKRPSDPYSGMMAP